MSAPTLFPEITDPIVQRIAYDPADALPDGHPCYPCSIDLHTIPEDSEECVCCGQGAFPVS